MIYYVTVKPRSFKEEVIGAGEGELIVRTRKKAHDGEANKATIELLAKYFGVSKTKIQIVKGATSKHKVIEISE